MTFGTLYQNLFKIEESVCFFMEMFRFFKLKRAIRKEIEKFLIDYKNYTTMLKNEKEKINLMSSKINQLEIDLLRKYK